MQLSLAILSGISLSLLATAAPTGHYPPSVAGGPSRSHVDKRMYSYPPYSPLTTPLGANDVLSPIFSPDRSISAGGATPTIHGPSAIPHPKHAFGSGATQKVPWKFPWQPKEPPLSPKPKLWNPVLESEHPAKPKSLVPIAEGIRGGLAGLAVFSPKPKLIITDPVAPTTAASAPVVVSGSAMSATELARNIVAQIEVECPHCGYGTDPRSKTSSKFTAM